MTETAGTGSSGRAEQGLGPDLSRFYEEVEAGREKGTNSHAILLGFEPVDSIGLVRRVEEGFPYRALERLRTNMGLSREAVADIVQIKARTLDRRRERGRLEPEESDRLLRVARIFGRAIGLFEGDAGAAKRWLSSPQRTLGGATPLEMAKTETGAREVENLIGRLEHGVFT